MILSRNQGEASCTRSNTSRSSHIQELGRLVRAGSNAKVVQIIWKGSSTARDAAEVLGVEPGLEWAAACVDSLADVVHGSRNGAYVLVQTRANTGLVCSIEEEVGYSSRYLASGLAVVVASEGSVCYLCEREGARG